MWGRTLVARVSLGSALVLGAALALAFVADGGGASSRTVDVTAAAAPEQSAGTVRGDALVLVNSASDSYADFTRLVQPYLDNFGVPYTVLDISASPVPDNVGGYGLIIVGHRRLDVGGAYLDAAEQAGLDAAVTGGTGLVNFDNDLWSSTGDARYAFLQSVFGFGRGGSQTGTGVVFSSLGGSAGGGGSEVIIEGWDDAHQEPALETTTSASAVTSTDGKWTEFLYSSRRTYPAVFAGANEYENYGLTSMRFFASGVEDGEYDVYANLYTQATGRDMRYYFGYSPTATKQYSVDTVGGTGGTAQFTEYRLGSVVVTGGAFSLYAQDADLLSGSNDVFGWAWIRLVPAVSPPATTAHYITARHGAEESIATGTMRLPGITLPASAAAVAVTDNQPLIAVTSHGAGHAVQWGSYDWMSHAVLGPVHGLDDLMWRSLVWAARKPFVLQALPPIATMRADDGKGPFRWIHDANDFGFKPWVGVFLGEVSETAAADLSGLTNAGLATASVHSITYDDHFYFDHANQQDLSDDTIASNFAAGTRWHTDHDIPISKFVLPHHYELGTNVFDGLEAWGVEFVGTVIVPGTNYSSHWLMGGPYRRYETGWSSPSVPLAYADFLAVPGRSDLDGAFFNLVTEIRDENGYEWYPDNDVAATVGHGVRQLERAFDSRVVGTLFTHEYYIPLITAGNWRAIMEGVSSGIADYQPVQMTMDAASQYVRALATSSVSSVTYDSATETVLTTLTGQTDTVTRFSIFTSSGDGVDERYVDVPAFSGSTEIVTQLGSSQGDITPPVITAVTAETVTESAATVSWTTDEASTSQVEYGTTTSYGSTTPGDTALTTTHSQAISGLAPATVYHFRVVSQDAAGNTAVSPDATFTTGVAPALSIGDVTVTEGDSGTINAVFTVSLSSSYPLVVTVAYQSADGTAQAGGDYAATSGDLVFLPGQTIQTLSVPVQGDTLHEPDETLSVVLSAPQNASLADAAGWGVIRNDDAPPTISIGDVTVTEGDSGTSSAVFTVSLSAASGLPVAVDHATASGSAQAGSDYVTSSGRLSFDPGQTSRTIVVPVSGDVRDEFDETFAVELSAASGASIADGRGIGTIADDDPAPALSINNVSMREGRSGYTRFTFTVSLSAVSAKTVSVSFTTTGSTATPGSDFVAASGTLTFAAGTTSQRLTISVIGDRLRERNEVFLVYLANPVNATVTVGQGIGHIINDD